MEDYPTTLPLPGPAMTPSSLSEYGDTVRGALLLHGGTETYLLGERILATPWWRVI